MKRVALGLILLLASGCASHARKAEPTATVPPPPAGAAPPAGTGTAPGGVPQHAGAISAPWDTAGTASGKAARRNHVYPSGTNPLGQKLVDSLPDPASLERGAQSSEPANAAAPPAPATAPAGAAPPDTGVAKPQPLPIDDRTCWEVQVLTTTDANRAREEARRIEKDFSLEVAVREDGGVYRVRVGGCLTADGAVELTRRLRFEGYMDAFRVMREP
jgi:hypothetical protein